MACLDDDALLRSIEPTTPLEIELARRLGVYVDQEPPEEIHRSYDGPMEQSEFRRLLLNEIMQILDNSEYPITDIKIAFENNQVEL